MNEMTNPFEKIKALSARADEARAIQEVQAAMVIAQKFPRDEAAALDRILKSCTRLGLAESASYAFRRGSELVTGPSIRLAEELARQWGHLQFGVREVTSDEHGTTVEAYAWDLQTNVRESREFRVPHVRYTRSAGRKQLDDPRDIYEAVASQGSRRLRACILAIIPSDITEAAERQCKITQEQQAGAPTEQIGKLVEAFSEYGVTEQMLERYLGHKLEALVMAEVVRFRQIIRSLKDGMAKVGDFFDTPKSTASEINDNLKDDSNA